MAIGNYWECVLPEGADTPLQRIVDGTTTLNREHFPSWRLKPDGEDLGSAEFACMGFPSGDMRAIVHLVKTPDRTNFYLHSAFPWLAAGAPARLTVHGMRTDFFGLEGLIEAGINGRRVTFFDPLFALNKGKYRIGAEYDFTLAAVSLNARRATPPDFDLMLAADPEASDHYLFRGYLHMVRSTSFLGQAFDVFRTAVMSVGGHHLFVDIYVGRHRLDPCDALASGATITGALWLQGCLAEEVRREVPPETVSWPPEESRRVEFDGGNWETNDHRYTFFYFPQWYELLNVAQEYGWTPRGTCLPVDQRRLEGWTKFSDEPFESDYKVRGRWKRVSAADAAALATALESAASAMEGGVEHSGWDRKRRSGSQFGFHQAVRAICAKGSIRLPVRSVPLTG
jgi:hypothetical protein